MSQTYQPAETVPNAQEVQDTVPIEVRRGATVREAIRSELGHTLNSRTFYIVLGVGIGLTVAILLHNRKGNTLL